jgi:hypothetical protein
LEYVFLFIFVIAAGFYFSDRKGWHATAKRLSTIVRANLEAGKPVAAIEPIKDQDDWVQKFKAIENPPSAALKPVNTNHMLVKTSYYKTESYGLWPQWHCKCGEKGHEATGSSSNGMESAKRRAKMAAETHFKTAIAAEEMQAKTGGKFSW